MTMAGQNLEDEMSRFEQEISGVSAGINITQQPLVIGASTFSSVQQQLSALRAQVYGTTQSHNEPGIQVPSGLQNSPHISAAPPIMSAMAPAPMPFLPPQLRSRAPLPQGFGRPPLQNPAMSFPERQPMMMVRPMQMPNTPHMMGPDLSNPLVSQQPAEPKIVYSAKPVLNKPASNDNTFESAQANNLAEAENRKRPAPIDESLLPKVIEGPSFTAPRPVVPTSDNHSFNRKPDTNNKKKKEKKLLRCAASDVWEDTSLADWDPNDFRIFCGDLGNEVTDEKLAEAFKKYPSLQKAKVIRDKRTHKTKGYGFISFKDPNDYTKAMREMNGKYVGNRPIKLRKSTWRDRNIEVVKKKEKEKKRLGFR